MPDREEIKPEENRIGQMPRGFRIGRKKGAKWYGEEDRDAQ